MESRYSTKASPLGESRYPTRKTLLQTKLFQLAHPAAGTRVAPSFFVRQRLRGSSRIAPDQFQDASRPRDSCGPEVCWCIPPSGSGEFVAAMEDVLKLYAEPYDPAQPVICMDETNKQLVGETRTPIAAGPGKPARIDYEYERRGTADVFLFTEPLGNWRCVDDHRESDARRLGDPDQEPGRRAVTRMQRKSGW